MKHLAIAGKAVTLLFTAALLVACSGSDTKDDEAAAAAAAAAAAQSAQRTAETQAAAEQQRLDEAAAAVGTVFYFEFDSSTLTAAAIPNVSQTHNHRPRANVDPNLVPARVWETRAELMEASS